MVKVLVVYYSNRPRLRTTTIDHLYSFQRRPGLQCVYLNLAVRRPWPAMTRLGFDLVVFDYSFLSIRFNRPRFRRLVRRARRLRDIAAVKVAIPQDEYVNTDLLCAFLRDMQVSHVFTAASEQDWPAIYGELDLDRVRLTTVLTGYLSDDTLATVERLRALEPGRTVDIGYRARDLPVWLGRRGRLKAEIAAEVQRLAPERGMTTDVSTREEDTLIGDDWFRLLLRSRATVGTEGGAGILDRDGSVRERTEAYLKRHPQASFADVEAACFPGRDGELHLAAISPRHLEACATRTVQILVEGAYNGVLEAHRHYIPVRPDLADLGAALDALGDADRCRRITDQAYNDVVASRRYHYDAFVDTVVRRSLEGRSSRAVPQGVVARAATAALREADRLSWRWVAVRFGLYSAVTAAARRLRAPRRLA
jgi:hypothetical protein